MRILIGSLPLWFALSLAPPLVAQAPGPDSVAAEFQTALREMAWWRVARLMHPQALQAFRARLDVMLEADESGRTGEAIFGTTEAAEYGAVPPEAVFVRVIEVMGAEMPGLIHALVVRDVEMLGAVLESTDLAHVVYRSQADLSGAKPEMRVITLKQSEEGWRVLEAPELVAVREAMRGLLLKYRRPPPDR